MRWGRAAGPLVVPGEGRGDKRETYQEVLQEREESGRFIARLRGWWEDVEVGGRGRSSSARAMGEVPSTPPPAWPSVRDLAQVQSVNSRPKSFILGVQDLIVMVL